MSQIISIGYMNIKKLLLSSNHQKNTQVHITYSDTKSSINLNAKIHQVIILNTLKPLLLCYLSGVSLWS